MTALAVFLLIAGWLLVYVGFTEPDGDLRKEFQAAFSGGGKPAGNVRPASGIPKGSLPLHPGP